MPWFKVDDTLWSHPKFATLSDAAQALWLRAGSYSAEKLTDGVIETAILTGLLRGRPKVIEELVAAGMWKRTKSGIEFHDWKHYQPSAENVKREREQARERMANVRANKRGSSGNPVPGPVPMTDVTNFPASSPDPNVRAEGLDQQVVTAIEERNAKAIERAASLGIKNPTAVWDRLERTLLGKITLPDAIRIAAVILDRSPTVVRNPEGYIATACKGTADEIRTIADQIDVQIGTAA